MNQGLESKGCLKKATRKKFNGKGIKKSGSRFFKQPPDSKPSAARLGFGQLIQATRALNNGADNFCMQVEVIQKFVLTCKCRSAYSERPLRSMALYSSFQQKLQLFNTDYSHIVTESGYFRNRDEIKPDEKRPTHPAPHSAKRKPSTSGYFTEYRLRRPTATAKQNKTETTPMMPPA